MLQLTGSNAGIKTFVTFLFSLRKLGDEDYNRQAALFFERQNNATHFKQQFSEETGAVFFTQSLTDAGINSNLGFFPELRQRIKYRILPPVNEDHLFSYLVADAFKGKENYQLLERLSPSNWEQLVRMAGFDRATGNRLMSQLENALIILTHQLVSIGIDPYIVKKLSYTDDSDSPFFRLNVLLNEYIKGTRPVEIGEVLDSLGACEQIFDYLKENRATLGISLHLTFLIRRAEQHIQRIRLLLRIHAAPNAQERLPLLQELLVTLVKAELHSNSIRYFIGENTGLLANRIANQTSAKGSHYIGFTKKENNRLLLSAMGGGLVVVFLVYIKHYLHGLDLPLLPEGILFGLNYGLGFVFMHFANLTLATKQPAMTASYIADSIEQNGIGKDSRKGLSIILAQIIRSQFISLIGNLIVVLPLCYVSAWALLKFKWDHVLTKSEASNYLLSNHPTLSGSLLFAAFTGVFLTLAGLITGYYDNKVVFSSIPQRLMNHPLLRRIMPLKWLQKFSTVISNNLGAIAGNLILGLCLGLAGNFGKFIGLPFDIRHVTISAGNFALAVSQGYGFPVAALIIIFGGVILIGIVNIISSFMLSFLIACRSRYLSSQQTWLVLSSLLSYLVKNPRIFLFRKDQVD